MDEKHDGEGRYCDDDGNELSPDLVPKPALCVSCAKDNGDPEEEVLCNLNRLDRQGGGRIQVFCSRTENRRLTGV